MTAGIIDREEAATGAGSQITTRTIAQIGDDHVVVGHFETLPAHCKFIALMPQWDFLRRANYVILESERGKKMLNKRAWCAQAGRSVGTDTYNLRR